LDCFESSKYFGMLPTVPGKLYDPGPGAYVFLISVFFPSFPKLVFLPSNSPLTLYYPGPGAK